MFNFENIVCSFVLCLVCACAFSPVGVATKASRMKMVVVGSDYPGQTAPLGFFDPLGLASRVSAKRLKMYREAELKHGRVAMLASLGMLVAESFNPLFEGRVMGPAIFHFQQMQNVFPSFWLFLLFGIGLVEGYTIGKGWESPNAKSTSLAMLNDDYIPGDLGFDPLNFLPEKPSVDTPLSPEFVGLSNKELNHCRLAMIGVAGIVAQELVDQLPVIEHYQLFGFSAATMI